MVGMTELHQPEYLVDVSGFSMNIRIMMALQLLSVQGVTISHLYFQIIYSLLYTVYQQRALQQLSSLNMIITLVQLKLFLLPQIPTLEALMTEHHPLSSLVVHGNCTCIKTTVTLVLHMDKVSTQLQAL